MFYTGVGFQRHHKCTYCTAPVRGAARQERTTLTARFGVARFGVAGLGVRCRLRTNRIEGIEQDQTGKKAADMRLPSDRLALLAADRHSAEAEQHVESEPDDEEHQEP